MGMHMCMHIYIACVHGGYVHRSMYIYVYEYCFFLRIYVCVYVCVNICI